MIQCHYDTYTVFGELLHNVIYTCIAFTAYTPSSLALQDLVRSQVTLAKHLIDHSKRLSDQLTGSLVPNHHYMTLDDTKEVRI